MGRWGDGPLGVLQDQKGGAIQFSGSLQFETYPQGSPKVECSTVVKDTMKETSRPQGVTAESSGRCCMGFLMTNSEVPLNEGQALDQREDGRLTKPLVAWCCGTAAEAFDYEALERKNSRWPFSMWLNRVSWGL